MFSIKLLAVSAVIFGCLSFVSGNNHREIQYEPIPTFNNYKSVVEPPDDTLEGIYNVLAKDFLDATVPINFDVSLFEDNVWTSWDDFRDKYAGFAAYVIVMLIIGLLVPIVGIIFAICRCCGVCGAKPTEKHPEHGRVSVIVAGGFTVLFTAFVAFAIAVGMRSNVVMEKGTEKVFDTAIVTMTDGIKYADNTNAQLEHLLSFNYKEFLAGFTTEVDGISVELNAHITNIGKPERLDEIKSGMRLLQKSAADMTSMKTAIAAMTPMASELRSLKEMTTNMVNTCLKEPHENPSAIPLCTSIQDIMNSWDIEEFGLPDLTETISKVEGVKYDDIEATLDGIQAFGDGLTISLVSFATAAKEKVAAAGVDIDVQLHAAQPQMNSVKQWMMDTIKDLKDTKGYVDDWSYLRYGLTFILPLLLIVIVVFVILGFLIGACCRTVYYKEKGCGNASVASDFFMINVSLIFIFTFAFAIAIIGYYSVGVLGQRYVCNTFETRDNIKGLEYLDRHLDVELFFGQDVTFKHLLDRCDENKSVYEVLKLQHIIDLEEIIKYLDTYKIREELTGLQKEIEKKINNFQISAPTEPFALLKALKLNEITAEPQEAHISTIHELILEMTELQIIHPTLQSIAILVIQYNNIILRLEEQNTNLQENFDAFKVSIQMGGTLSFIDRLDQFDEYLTVSVESITKPELLALGNKLVDDSVVTVQAYLDRIKDKMLTEVGLCEPANKAIKATLNQACGNVFNPINAFWVANFFALIAFIPLLIIFIAMASHFRQYTMTDEERYRQQQYYQYHPPGTRGSEIQAYDVRPHHQHPEHAHPPTDNPNPNPNPNPYYSQPHNPHPLPPYNPLYPNLEAPNGTATSSGSNTLTSAAGLGPAGGGGGGGGGGGFQKNPNAYGVNGRNLRRQQEYPYAMKGSSIASDASINGRDETTRF